MFFFMWTISINMETSKDNQFGKLLPNGSWTGMRGQVQRMVSKFNTNILQL